MRTVHVVVPEGIDDPARPSGGNTYDRLLCRGLRRAGWAVHEHAVAGRWPREDAASLAALAGVLERISDGAVVLIDGLIASAAPEALAPQASRLRLVVLVHMPLGHRPVPGGEEQTRARERSALAAAVAVITTSAWARRRLRELYPLAAERLHVAEPGVEPAELAIGSPSGESLLCLAAVTYDKGHDLLLDALASISGPSWHCACVGSLDRDPAFVDSLRRRVADSGLGERVSWPGPRTGSDLELTFAAADLLVLPSRAETYGIVIIEALARGLPVVAAEVGGVPEALGRDSDGTRPGLLVAPEDPTALAEALRAWLGDAELREELRRAARGRRESLPAWSATTSVVSGALRGASG